MQLLNCLLGILVTVVGFWLIWGTIAPVVVLGWGLVVGAFVWLKAKSITEIWAWATLLLGLESFAWPVVLMIQLKGPSESLPEAEMGTILSAVVLGLFSSVFWISFSYGLFKRAWRTDQPVCEEEPTGTSLSRSRKKKAV
ncbi:MAG: hypothetical protein U0223_05885 [Nitrospira sp.]|nr:hypothetical protein [Nitrospira sp.]MBX3324687.1 hypothetical protein [Nitrospira sp.]